MKKRILALMLTLAMVLSVLPGAVFAADTALCSYHRRKLRHRCGICTHTQQKRNFCYPLRQE